jgi:GNAT superfamily N-acetyltransferase
MSGQVNFVPAERKDLPVITQLAPEIWQCAYRKILSAEQIAYMLKMMYSPEKLQADFDSGVKFRLIDYGGRHVGFFAFFECGDEHDTLKLDKLYLHQDFHGQGIGSQVLQYLTVCASDAGYRKIILNVNKANSPAISAYTRNGFKKKESVKVDIGKGFFMDDFVMEKKLM